MEITTTQMEDWFDEVSANKSKCINSTIEIGELIVLASEELICENDITLLFMLLEAVKSTIIEVSEDEEDAYGNKLIMGEYEVINYCNSLISNSYTTKQLIS